MTVAELIKHLETFPQDLLVAHHVHSEQCLLELDDIRVEEHCVARDDGWVQTARPDMPKIPYLILS